MTPAELGRYIQNKAIGRTKEFDDGWQHERRLGLEVLELLTPMLTDPGSLRRRRERLAELGHTAAAV
jgi:hypothetical protein